MLAVVPASARADLEPMPLHELLTTYGNWRGQLVPPRPRRSHTSTELGESSKAVEHKGAFDAIIGSIQSGADLKPHLGRGIKIVHDPAADATGKLGRRMDRDLLIADWGVHHLHLSTTIESDGLVSRTGDLLFAAFTPDDAYLINIYPHGSWALKEVLETAVRNWPEAGLLSQVHYVVGLTQEYTDEERWALRNAGTTGPLEINGKVYMPPGQTLDGTPIAVTRRANAVMWALRGLRYDSDGRLAEIERLVDETAGHPVTSDWQAAVHEGWCGVVRGGIFVPVAELG